MSYDAPHVFRCRVGGTRFASADGRIGQLVPVSGTLVIMNDSSTSTAMRHAIPHWPLALIAAILGTVPWIPWSICYSLRTLLIVTTLIAVLLGLIVRSVK